MIGYSLAKKILFGMDPEEAHYFAMKALRRALHMPLVRRLFIDKTAAKGELAKTVAGITFPNPVGIAAGFDKNAVFLEELEALGFGFVEIGTVTPKAQDGNPKPRLFRLVEDGAVINRMGFNNDGLDAVRDRLKNRTTKVVIGGNIGKNKVTLNENAVHDYLHCFEGLYPFVDYFVLNVSSPNTPNLRELQDKDALNKLLTTVQQRNSQFHKPKPVFLKIAPDLSIHQLDEIIEIVKASGIAGIIATNTTISREGLKTPKSVVEQIGAGGLSGAPLKDRSLEILKYLRERLPQPFAIISSGGIMAPEDVSARIAAGADLVQIYTGFIYYGPDIVKDSKRKLMEEMPVIS